MSDSKEQCRSRPCGKLELWSVIRVRNELYSNVLVALKYAPQAQLSRTHFHDLVSQKLRDVVIPALPLLSCRIRSDPSDTARTPYYESRRRSQVPVVLVQDCQSIQDFLRREHDDRPSDDELWRVSIVPEGAGFWVSFTFHHAIGDGTSGLIFHEHLLRALQDSKHAVAREQIIRPLPPPIEDCGLDLRVSWGDLLREIPNFVRLPAFINKYLHGPDYYGGNKTSYKQRRKTKVGLQCFSLTSAEIDKLKTQAKVNKVSIHALLHASAVHCIETDKAIRTTTPISLRPLIPEEFRKEMGNYITAHSSVAEPQEDILVTAKNFYRDLNEPAQRLRDISAIGKLQYIREPNSGELGGMQKIMLDRLNTTNDHCLNHTLEISNLGIWKAPELADWRVEDIHFTGSNSPIGELFNLGVITLAGGIMKVSCTYIQGFVDDEEVVRFMRNLRETLQSL